MKRLFSIILVIILSINSLMISFANEYMGAWATDNTGTWYRYNDGTYPTCNFFTKDGKLYYVNQDGYLLPNTQLYNGYQTDSEGAIIEYNTNKNVYQSIYDSNGWKQDEKGWWYQNTDGSYPKNTDLKVDGKLYWVGTDGYMLYNCYARDHRYYGSDGAFTGEIDRDAAITITQPAPDTRSIEEQLADYRVDDSLKPAIWKKVCESAKGLLKYKNTAIFPEWNHEGISYRKNPKDGTILVYGWCQAKNGIGNYLELSISAMISSDGTVTYCSVDN